MTIADVMADQRRLPRGPLASLVARTLNRRNGDLIARTIEELDLAPGHRVWPPVGRSWPNGHDRGPTVTR